LPVTRYRLPGLLPGACNLQPALQFLVLSIYNLLLLFETVFLKFQSGKIRLSPAHLFANTTRLLPKLHAY